MKEESNAYLGFGCFFLFILGIVVVGSFLLYQSKREKVEEQTFYEEQEPVSYSNLKVDQTKDFVYYEQEENISQELSLVYKYPVVNLNSEGAKEVTATIKDLVDQKKTTLLRMQAKPADIVCTTSTDIYQAEIVDFGIFSYDNYITLVVYVSPYSCVSGLSTIVEMQSYTFSVITGELVFFEELLKMYRTTLSEMKLLVREELMENQTYVEGVPYIRIDETIASFKENVNMIFYVDESGELVMKYVVKTNGVDYNDTISISLK